MTAVAIDFGTSNTVVCIQDPITQTPRTLKFESISRCFEMTTGQADVVPSLVFVQDPNHLVIGEAVRRLTPQETQQSRLFQAFKRDLTADYRPPDRQIDGYIYSPESISESFIAQLWQQVVAQQIQPTRAIFTVPVGAFDRYRNWIQALAQRLHLPTVQIVDESTAAAFGYGITRQGSVVLVVDFGGGTLDLSLVRTVAPNRGQKVLQAEVVAKSEAFVGGVDIDTWMVENYLQKIGASRAKVTPTTWQNLLEVAEGLKIQLSTATEATANWFDTDRAISHSWHLTRAELEQILASQQLLAQLRDALEEVLVIANSQGIGKDEIDRVLLVGGTCQIPTVQQLISSYFDPQRLCVNQPFTAVAQGALNLGQLIGVDDYLQHGYAIRLWDTQAKTYSYYPLFEKGTRYPSQRPRVLLLQAAGEEQCQMRLEIGELTQVASVEVTYNEQGQITSNPIPQPTEFRILADLDRQDCRVPLTPPGKIGTDRIQLTLTVNEQRVLVLTVKDLVTQRLLLDRAAMVANASQSRTQTATQGLEPIDGAVLGGLAGAKKRLGVTGEEDPISKYGLFGPSGKEEPISQFCEGLYTDEVEAEPEPQILLPKVDWSLLECRYHLTGHTNSVTSIAISPNGQTLVSGSRDKSIRLWQIGTGTWLRTLTGHHDAVTDLAISPDGKLLASGSQDKTIKLWHLRSGEWLRTVTGQDTPVFTIAFSPDGQTLASGGWDEAVMLRQIYQKAPPRKFFGHSGGVSAIAFSPDGQTLASCSGTTIKVWHLATGQLMQTLTGHSDLVVAIAISPNGQMLASGGGMRDKTIKLWDLGTGELMCNLSEPRTDVLSIAFSPDGQTLASGSYRTIHLWDLNTGELLRTLPGHSGDVFAIAFSPDGKTLASGSADGSLKIWELP